MERFTQQFNQKAKQIRLQTSEREDLRERLLMYMEYHPLPEDQEFSKRRLRKNTQARLTPANVWLWSKVAGAISVFFIMIVPVMAEQALPGDALYPVKVSFNEEIRGILTSSPYEKIEWETERLERRVAEAKLLADSGRLTAEAEEDMAQAIKQHSQSAQNSIDFIRESDRDEATIAEIALASALDISVSVLSNSDKASGATSSVTTAASEARNLVDLGDEKLSYQKLMTSIEAETTSAHEYLNGLGDNISDSDRENVERRLEDIKEKVEEASELNETDPKAATSLLVEALGSINKVVSFVTRLEVRNSISIDELIPSVSPEEKKLIMEKTLQETNLMVTEVKTAIKTLATTSSNYVELSEGVKEYDRLHASSSSLLSEGKIKEAKKSVEKTLAWTDSLVKSLLALGIEISLPETDSNESDDLEEKGSEDSE